MNVGRTPLASERANGRQRELAEFLRARRTQLRPEQLGLHRSARRRAPGLLREEVAALAGVSTSWYTYLEQGRPVRPSRQVLDSLAKALQLNDDERRYLVALAAPDQSARTDQPTTVDTATRLIATVGHTPNPVYVGTQHGDLVAWNEATTVWYTDFGSWSDGEPNMLRWLLEDPRAREQLPNWVQDTRDMVGRLRAAYADRPHDSRLCTLVDLSLARSREFREWWDEQHVAEQRTRRRHLRAVDGREQTFELLALKVADDPFTSLIVHVSTS